jgi:hypothetical protein
MQANPLSEQEVADSLNNLDAVWDELFPAEQARNALVIAIVRGHIWRNLLESGKANSIAEIPRANKVDGSYVSRILNLMLLAPDIVEAILDGKEPSDCSLAKLTKPFPVLWDEQRRELGFPSVSAD